MYSYLVIHEEWYPGQNRRELCAVGWGYPLAPDKAKGRSVKGRRRTVAVAALVVVILLAGSGLAYLFISARDEGAGAFVYYTGHPVISLDPADAADLGSRLPIENIFDTLVRQKGTSPEEFQPALATGWSASENGLWYNFTLRQGVKFSNGNGFNASDVLFTIERIVKMASPDTGSSVFMSNCVDLASTRVLGAYEVSVKLLAPRSSFLSFISQAFPMGMVDREYALSHYAPNDLYAHDYLRLHPVGTGPFKLRDWSVGTELTLVASKGYWGGWDGDRVQRVVIRFEPDPELRLGAVRSGVAEGAELPAALKEEVETIQDAQFLTFPSAHMEIVAMNARQGTGGQAFMRDPDVRLALSHAFDYENTSSGVYMGIMTPLSGCIPQPMPYAAESQPSKGFAFNLTRASELLNDSGYPLNIKGFRFDALAVKLLYEPGDGLRKEAAEGFASSLRRLGILVELAVYDRPGPVVDRVWDLYFASLEAWYLDPESCVTSLAVSSGLGGDIFGTGVNNPDIDSAASLAAAGHDGSSRITNYTVVWQELNGEPSMIFVGQLPTTIVVRNEVDVLNIDPITSLDLYSIRMV